MGIMDKLNEKAKKMQESTKPLIDKAKENAIPVASKAQEVASATIHKGKEAIDNIKK